MQGHSVPNYRETLYQTNHKQMKTCCTLFVCAIAHPRSLEGLGDEDVADVAFASCLDDFGRENIVVL